VNDLSEVNLNNNKADFALAESALLRFSCIAFCVLLNDINKED